VFTLPVFQLIDVVVIHLDRRISHCLLPRRQSIELLVSVNSILGTIEELLRKFESSNKHEPRVPDVTLANLAALLFEPVALGVDEF
jgi:hypothetical protein